MLLRIPLLIALALPLAAADQLWLASVATYSGAQAADIASSYGKYEANPLYGQRFTARDVGLKMGIAGAILLAEWALTRRNPRARRALSFVKFAASGAVTAVAVRNLQ